MSTQKTVMVGDVPFGGDNPIAFIMGPCQLENRDHAMMMAERVANACAPTGSKFVFKTSYDKANRSSITSARGIGMDEGLRILAEVRDTFGCPVITDVHEVSHCAPAAEVVDVIQIPAFSVASNGSVAGGGKYGQTHQCEKGSVFGPMGNAQCRRKNCQHGEHPDHVVRTRNIVRV